MESGNVSQGNRFEGCPDIRIITFCQKAFPEIAAFLPHCLKYRHKGQQALVYEEILQLLMNKRVSGGIDEPAVGFKHCMILFKTPAVHMVAEGVGITSVIVEGLLAEIYAFGFQHTCISDGPVFSDDNIVGKTEQIPFQKLTPKQFVP